MADGINLLPSVQSTSDALCYTTIPTETFKTKWIIENVMDCHDVCLKTAQFSTGQVTWHHQLKTKSLFGHETAGVQYVALCTVFKCIENSKGGTTASLSTKIKTEVLRAETNETTVFTAGGCITAGNVYEYRTLEVKRSDLESKVKDFLIHNALQLNIEVTIIQSARNSEVVQFALPKSQFLPKLTSLFSDTTFSDVKIAVGKEEFPCHKAILAVRSTVFAAMFKHEMTESHQNQVVISDIQPEVFKELLRFIYTDQVEGLDKVAIDLLPVADKYALEDLKALCEHSLFANISVESTLETLLVADFHRADQLKRHCIGFICRNRSILATEQWKKLCLIRSDLVTEILSASLDQLNV